MNNPQKDIEVRYSGTTPEMTAALAAADAADRLIASLIVAGKLTPEFRDRLDNLEEQFGAGTTNLKLEICLAADGPMSWQVFALRTGKPAKLIFDLLGVHRLDS